jgi:hypothetical protein
VEEGLMGYDWKVGARKAAAVAGFGAVMVLGHYLSDERNVRELMPSTTAETAIVALASAARFLNNWSKHRLPPTSVDEVTTKPVLSTEAEMDSFAEAYVNLRRVKVPWEDARTRALEGVLSERDIK